MKIKLALDLDLGSPRDRELLRLLAQPPAVDPKLTEEPPPLIAAMKAGVQ